MPKELAKSLQKACTKVSVQHIFPFCAGRMLFVRLLQLELTGEGGFLWLWCHLFHIGVCPCFGLYVNLFSSAYHTISYYLFYLKRSFDQIDPHFVLYNPCVVFLSLLNCLSHSEIIVSAVPSGLPAHPTLYHLWNYLLIVSYVE